MIFPETKFQDISFFTLSNKTSLTHLELNQTHLSPETWADICQQIKHLNLSENHLSQVSSLILSNKTLLNHLDLRNTQMSTRLIEMIFQQITNLENLKTIHMAGFTIDTINYSARDINLPTELFRGK